MFVLAFEWQRTAGCVALRSETREDWIADFQYLNRIVFCEMLKDDRKGLEGLTGFGITQKPWDGDDRVVTVDVEAQTVEIGGKTQSIAEYIASEDGW